MYSHLLPSEYLGADSFYLPPEKLIELPYPADEWYRESDPFQHERIIRLTRGIHLFNEWWRKQELWIHYHISEHAFYQIEPLPELEEAVREIHKRLHPQQKLDERFLVFGNGATQIVNAALYASAVYHSIKDHPPRKRIALGTTLYVTEQLPGYLEDSTLVQLLHKDFLYWIHLEDHEKINPKDLLEFITTPNNPDGRIIKQKTQAAYTIHDRVNHWGFLLNEDNSAIKEDTLENDCISIFSLSKILSFSGSRVGYAFVKNAKIAHFMKYYTLVGNHGLVSDSQYRCLVALRYLLDEPSRLEEYTTWIRSQLEQRWNLLRETLLSTSLHLLNRQGPNAWIKTPSSSAATYLMKHYRVMATYGEEYGADSSHARINLLCKPNEFDEFIWRLKNL